MNRGFLAIRTISRGFRSTVFAQVKIVEVVPPLGESITEGSISKWMKNVGEEVKVDDIVVVVETDKVTVDIKSNHSGVLTRQLCLDTVIVGKDLYEVDTDGTATVAPTKKAETTTVVAPVVEPQPVDNHAHGKRTPSIKFLGKRSHVKVEHKSAPAAPTGAPKPTKPQTGVDFLALKGGAFFGRPVLSQREIDAIETGGAM